MSIDYDSLMQLLRARRSVRRFVDRPLAAGVVEQLVAAASSAPSAGNRQAYRLLVVSDRVTIGAMAEAVRQGMASIAARARPDRAEDLQRYLGSFLAFESAPTVIAAIHRAELDLLAASAPGAVEPAPSRVRSELDSISSVAAAIMQLLLAAECLGLGACWMTGPLVAAHELSALLGVPEGWHLAALVPVGLAAERPSPPRRRPEARLWTQVPPAPSDAGPAHGAARASAPDGRKREDEL